MSTITAGTTSGIQINGNDGSTNMTLQYGTGTNGVVLNSSGAIGVGSSTSYGTSGQVLVSNNSGSATSWGTTGTSISKAIALDLTFGWFK
jgi:hypothetical protein